MSDDKAAAPQAYSHTLRVTFAYDAEHLTLQSVKRVAMLAPAPTTMAPGPGAVGYWLAVEDAAGTVVYHIPLHDPLRAHRELFEESADGGPRRTPTSRPGGTFEVLVPDLPGGARLVLHGPPHGAQPALTALTTGAAPLASHSLDDLRRLASDEAGSPPPPSGGDLP